jgi:two-component system chemotaxis response regulator CheY
MASALHKLRNGTFHFVSDINMSNMNGFQLLAEIKKDENQSTPSWC